MSYDRRHGCVHCGSLTFSNEYFKAFKVKSASVVSNDFVCKDLYSCGLQIYPYVQVLICNSCKQQEELIAKVRLLKESAWV